MSVETNCHRAGARVTAERETVGEKEDALAAFEERVRSLSTASNHQATGTATGALAVQQGSRRDSCEAVRTAFAETVVKRVDSESVLATVKSELGEGVALALAPTTGAQFTPQVQQQVLSATSARTRELSVTERALQREAESVGTHAGTVDEIVDWLVAADETPLPELGFDGLAARHERLQTFERRCAEAAEHRQETLRQTTSVDGSVGVSHRSLVASLYEDFPVGFPVLSTLARLLSVLADAGRAVRRQLSYCG